MGCKTEQNREWTAQLICSLHWYGTRLPLGQQGAKPVLLFTVPEAVSSHSKERSRSAVQRINFEQNLSLAPRWPRGNLILYNSKEKISFNSFHAPQYPRGSLVPYKSNENQIHPFLAWLGPSALMGLGGTMDLPDQISPCLIPVTRYHLSRYQIPNT